MRGEANYVGTAGTCVGAPTGTCDNTEAGHTCSDDAGCDWSLLVATAGGTANLNPEQPQQPPAVVPTMTEWGMFIFMVFAGIVSLYYLRKQRKI
jgi:hypothetical protein